MPNVLDSLTLELNADLDPLRKAMKNAAGIVQGGAKDITGALNKVDNALSVIGVSFAGMLTAQGIQSLWQMGRAALSAAGDLAELAEQSALSTENLQVLVAAGLTAGVATEDMAKSIGRFANNMVDAATKGNEMSDTFAKLGIATKTSAGGVRDVMDVLLDTADAMQKIEDPAKRVNVAMDIGGKGFIKLIPILSQGRAGFEKFAEEAKKMGLVLSRDQVDAADKASDKLALLDEKSRKLNQTIAAELMPTFVEWTVKLKEWFAEIVKSPSAIDKLDERIGALQERMARGGRRRGTLGGAAMSQDAIAEELDSAQEMRRRLGQREAESLRSKSKDDGVIAPGKESSVDKFIRGLSNETMVMQYRGLAAEQEKAIFQARELARANKEELTPAQEERIRSLIKLKDTLKAVEQKEKELSDEYKQEAEALEKFGQQLAEQPGKRMQLVATYDKEIERNKKLIDALGMSTEAYEKQKAVFEILDEFRRQGLSIGEKEIEQAERIAETLGKQRDKIKDLSDSHADLKEAGRDATRTIASGLEDMIVSGGKASDMLKALGQDIVRIIARLAITKPIEKGASSIFDSISGSAASSGGDIFGSIISSIFSGAPSPGSWGGYMADGGPVKAGESYIVGDAGPEMFVPEKAGHIIPNRTMKSGPTVFIDARGADQAAIARLERMILTVDGSVDRRAVAAVIASSGRGGSMTAAMRRKN